MDEHNIKMRALIDAAHAIYYGSREREKSMWGGFKEDDPFTRDEALKFKDEWGDVIQLVLDVFGSCEAAGATYTAAMAAIKEIEVIGEKHENDDGSNWSEFLTDDEREAGMDKWGL